MTYYNKARAHRSLGGQTPVGLTKRRCWRRPAHVPVIAATCTTDRDGAAGGLAAMLYQPTSLLGRGPISAAAGRSGCGRAAILFARLEANLEGKFGCQLSYRRRKALQCPTPRRALKGQLWGQPDSNGEQEPASNHRLAKAIR
jgi:hypothetical protein